VQTLTDDTDYEHIVLVLSARLLYVELIFVAISVRHWKFVVGLRIGPTLR